jgi:hypothetical protein
VLTFLRSGKRRSNSRRAELYIGLKWGGPLVYYNHSTSWAWCVLGTGDREMLLRLRILALLLWADIIARLSYNDDLGLDNSPHNAPPALEMRFFKLCTQTLAKTAERCSHNHLAVVHCYGYIRGRPEAEQHLCVFRWVRCPPPATEIKSDRHRPEKMDCFA